VIFQLIDFKYLNLALQNGNCHTIMGIGENKRVVAMRAKLDSFGRVVIPKSIRDHMGLRPDDALEIEERKNGILLKFSSAEPVLEYQEEILVVKGELTEQAGDIVKEQRDKRLRKFFE
jgi:AbrB family looped-hinge helix DNA binding protein